VESVTGRPFSEGDVRAVAATALSAALRGAVRDAVALVEALDRNYRGEGLLYAMVVWCDQVVLRLPGYEPGTPIALTFYDAERRETLADPDRVPPVWLWSTRLIAARAEMDQGAWNALIDGIPGGETGAYVGAACSSVVSRRFALWRRPVRADDRPDGPVTPQELYAAIDAVRRDRRVLWWQVAVELDITVGRLAALRRGQPCRGIAERAPAWLERHTGPPSEE
jgi:hypothetical protein